MIPRKIARSLKNGSPVILLLIYVISFSLVIREVEKGSYLNNISLDEKSLSEDFEKKCSWSASDGSFLASVHFVLSTVTTIGYGDLFPCSTYGQLLTILLSLTGIPVTMVCLARLGQLLASGAERLWLIYIKLKLFISHFVKKTSLLFSQNRTTRNVENYDEYKVVTLSIMPISFGIFLAILWLLLSSIYFYFVMSNDGVTFFDAFYFVVISVLTIGLGDFVPKNFNLVWVNFFFIVVGLALVSMCISIIQMQMENMFDQALDRIQLEYKERMIASNADQNDEKNAYTSSNEVTASQNVRRLLAENDKTRNRAWSSPKYLPRLMGEHKRRQLAKEWTHAANMICRGSQVEPEMRDKSIGTDTGPSTRDRSSWVQLDTQWKD